MICALSAGHSARGCCSQRASCLPLMLSHIPSSTRLRSMCGAFAGLPASLLSRFLIIFLCSQCRLFACCGSSYSHASTMYAPPPPAFPCPHLPRVHALLSLFHWQSLAPATTTVRMRQAIEKSEVLQVACDSYPMWLRKRPSDNSESHRFRCSVLLPPTLRATLSHPVIFIPTPTDPSRWRRLMPVDAFHSVCAPPIMRSLWKMSFFYSVRVTLQPHAAPCFTMERSHQVFDGHRPFITLNELCTRPWKFRFKQVQAQRATPSPAHRLPVTSGC
jgi:hypothetical protein